MLHYVALKHVQQKKKAEQMNLFSCELSMNERA